MTRVPLHLVVVDDDDAYRHVVVLAVHACHDGPVREFADGELALASLATMTSTPTLWVVDLHMPGMPGLEVITRLRALQPAAMVAAFSGAPTEAERAACLAAGAMAVLRKPASFGEVVECIRGLLRSCVGAADPP